eukprot:29913-Pelagococcus_subviridis.AAC.4
MRRDRKSLRIGVHHADAVVRGPDGPEPGVERADHALFLDHLRHAPEHAVRVRGVRHEPDARRLERAEEDVDGVPVVPRLLLRHALRGLDLEVLHAAELEPALHEVPERGGAEAGEQRARALLRDHLVKPGNHAGVLGRLELHARLHDVHGRERAVRDGAADAARERALEEVVQAVLSLAGRRHEAGGRVGELFAHRRRRETRVARRLGRVRARERRGRGGGVQRRGEVG